MTPEEIHWENFGVVRKARWCKCREDSYPHAWLPPDHPLWPSDHDRVPPSLNWELDQFQDDARFAGIIPKPASGGPNHPGMWTPQTSPPANEFHPDWLFG